MKARAAAHRSSLPFQALTFTSGVGKAVVGGEEQEIKAGDLVVVPAGTLHQFYNTGPTPLILYVGFKQVDTSRDGVRRLILRHCRPSALRPSIPPPSTTPRYASDIAQSASVEHVLTARARAANRPSIRPRRRPISAFTLPTGSSLGFPDLVSHYRHEDDGSDVPPAWSQKSKKENAENEQQIKEE